MNYWEDKFQKEYLKSNRYVHDIEVYKNFFSAIFIDIKRSLKFEYVIFNDGVIDQREKLITFLTNGKKLLIGYNNVGYDGAVLTYIIENPECTNDDIYQFSKYIIERIKPKLIDYVIKAQSPEYDNNKWREYYEQSRKKNWNKKTLSKTVFLDKVKKYIDTPNKNNSLDDQLMIFLKENKENIAPDKLLKQCKLILNMYEDSIRETLMPFRYPRDTAYKQLDLMLIEAFHKVGVSLKQISVNLRHEKVQDLPLKVTHIVTEDEIPLLLKYNLNDVFITYKLYRAMAEEIELRESLSLKYTANVMNASRSKVGNVLLEKMYTAEVDIDINELREQRTIRKEVNLAECIGKGIEFQTPILQGLLAKIKTLTTKMYGRDQHIKVKLDTGYSFTISLFGKFKYKSKIVFDNTKYTIGVGGLHSDDKPGSFKTDNNHIIRDADAASYYPMIMLNNNIKPEHLSPKFSEILGTITFQRLDAKARYVISQLLADKIEMEALKITINSLFGKLGSDTYWLYDPKALLSVTISGQLYLLMLIERLSLAGIQTISANTDGIVCKIPVQLEDEYYEICKQWEKDTNFTLEYTDYSNYYRLNVNNYMTIKPDGKIKLKGQFETKTPLNKGYENPIVRKALYEYFVNGIPVEKTIRECTDIMEFCISKKASGKFKFEYHRSVNDREELQKTNRFYIGYDGHSLMKRNTETGAVAGLFVGKPVVLLNDYDKRDTIDSYKVLYDYYIKKANDVVDDILPKVTQTSFLF